MKTFDFKDRNGSVPAKRHVNPDGSEGGWVADTATVEASCHIGPEVQVFGTAWVSDNAKVFRGQHVVNPLVIQGSRDVLTLDGDYINIGCKSHTIEHWIKNYKDIGERQEYTEEEIAEYRDYVSLLAHIKESRNVK